ncbi:MAG: hypothetical protein A2086_09190 [Spirochaetes bacterium GWD1_27_9]|nr:MAG: hypothetical protein A2Z98_13005 [Spirochaetes bacterium GWB1_27_13]OHD20416.1 MAG: hypothetical protein A2Y34_10545 [Spirochaetes bacterium GWC1_27_15]OHD31986.1 MAG: hypothetical protein A2086_09190 [Spirochaetes bacterium GWD1_27_9]
MQNILIELKNITKLCSNSLSINNLSLQILSGEIHSIVGMKGSGKSALVKIIAGIYELETYTGELIINGVTIDKNTKSNLKNIGVVYQDQNLIKDMTILENIFLGNEIKENGIIKWKKQIEMTYNLFEILNINLDPDTKLKSLSLGEQQLVKIIKAITKDPKIIIFDEPTIGLTKIELENLFCLIKKLKEKGITCIYFTKELEEALKISDRVSILKEGKIVFTEINKDLNKETILSLISGRESNRTKNIDLISQQWGITEREKEIIIFLIKGYSNKEISGKLFISINTVKTHIAKIYQKLGINQRIDLINLILDFKE